MCYRDSRYVPSLAGLVRSLAGLVRPESVRPESVRPGPVRPEPAQQPACFFVPYTIRIYTKAPNRPGGQFGEWCDSLMPLWLYP